MCVTLVLRNKSRLTFAKVEIYDKYNFIGRFVHFLKCSKAREKCFRNFFLCYTKGINECKISENQGYYRKKTMSVEKIQLTSFIVSLPTLYIHILFAVMDIFLPVFDVNTSTSTERSAGQVVNCGLRLYCHQRSDSYSFGILHNIETPPHISTAI